MGTHVYIKWEFGEWFVKSYHSESLIFLMQRSLVNSSGCFKTRSASNPHCTEVRTDLAMVEPRIEHFFSSFFRQCGAECFSDNHSRKPLKCRFIFFAQVVFKPVYTTNTNESWD